MKTITYQLSYYSFFVLGIVTTIILATVADDLMLTRKQHIEREIKKRLEPLNAEQQLDKSKTVPFNQNDLLERLKRNQTYKKRLEHLYAFVKTTEPDILPHALVNLFIEQDAHFFRPYVIALNEYAIEPLIENYSRVSLNDKVRILFIIQEIASLKALPFLRQEMQNSDSHLRSVVIRTVQLIIRKQTKEKLYQLLEEPNQEPLITKIIIETIIERLKYLHQNKWQTAFIRAVLKGKLPFESLWQRHFNLHYLWQQDFEPNDSLKAEEVISNHIPFLQAQLQKKEQTNTNKKNVVVLLSLLKHRTHLKKLFPLLEKMLRVHFSYGKTLNYWNQDRHYHHFRSDSDNWPWNFTNTQVILKHIETGLLKADIREWLDKEPKSLLKTLYLEQLLIKKGERSQKISLENILVEIMVLDIH